MLVKLPISIISSVLSNYVKPFDFINFDTSLTNNAEKIIFKNMYKYIYLDINLLNDIVIKKIYILNYNKIFNWIINANIKFNEYIIDFPILNNIIKYIEKYPKLINIIIIKSNKSCIFNNDLISLIISKCLNIQILSLDNIFITDELMIKIIPYCKELKCLTIKNCNISKITFDQIAINCKKLQSLLIFVEININLCSFLHNFNNITDLCININQFVNYNTVEELFNAFPNLNIKINNKTYHNIISLTNYSCNNK